MTTKNTRACWNVVFIPARRYAASPNTRRYQEKEICLCFFRMNPSTPSEAGAKILHTPITCMYVLVCQDAAVWEKGVAKATSCEREGRGRPNNNNNNNNDDNDDTCLCVWVFVCCMFVLCFQCVGGNSSFAAQFVAFACHSVTVQLRWASAGPSLFARDIQHVYYTNTHSVGGHERQTIPRLTVQGHDCTWCMEPVCWNIVVNGEQFCNFPSDTLPASQRTK